MDTRSVIVSMGIVGVVAAFLRLTGLTANFWLTLGFVGVPVVLYWIQSAIRPQNEKLANGVSRFAIGWSFFFILLPAILTSLSLNLPYTSESAKLARQDTGLRISEFMNPAGYRGRLAYREFCERDVRRGEMEQKQALDALILNRESGSISDSEFLKKREVIKGVVELLKKRREECSEWVIGDRHPRKILARLEGASGRQWFVGLGMLVIGGFVVAVVFGNPAVSRGTFRLAILVGILVATSQLLWDDALANLAKEGMLPGKYPSELASGRSWFWILGMLLLGGSLLASLSGSARLKQGVWGLVILGGLLLFIDWTIWLGGLAYLKGL